MRAMAMFQQLTYRLASHSATSAVADSPSRVQSPNWTQASRPRRRPNNFLFLLLVSRCSFFLTKSWCLAKSADVRLRLRNSASRADFASSVSDWRSEANCSSSSSLSSAYSCWNSESMDILSVNAILRQERKLDALLVGLPRLAFRFGGNCFRRRKRRCPPVFSRILL
jgi:hypothetical protein